MSKAQRLFPPACQVPFPKPSVSHTRESSPVVHLWERGCPIWLCETSVCLTPPVCTVVQMGTFSRHGQAPAHPPPHHPSSPWPGICPGLHALQLCTVPPSLTVLSAPHTSSVFISPWGKQPEEKTMSQALGTSSVREEVIHISRRDGYRVGRREMD